MIEGEKYYEENVARGNRSVSYGCLRLAALIRFSRRLHVPAKEVDVLYC